jgi:hypothetical protein
MIWAGVLVADNGLQGFSGEAGWVGTGLLGAVLSWLFLKHLPSKDQQIRDLLHDKDSQINEIVKSHKEAVTQMTADLRQELVPEIRALREVIQGCRYAQMKQKEEEVPA